MPRTFRPDPAALLAVQPDTGTRRPSRQAARPHRRTIFCPAFIYQATALLLIALLPAPTLWAQDDAFDAGWYNPNQPYVKIGVVEDGMYRLTGQALTDAGVPLGSIDPALLQLFENGREIPIHLFGGDDGLLTSTDALAFLGRRNRGAGEAWAYDYLPDHQSSTFLSLYTDTTYYWLTWNNTPGLRYAPADDAGPANTTPVTALPDTLHLEQDVNYFHGEGTTNVGMPLYTHHEGFYWSSFHITDGQPIAIAHNATLTSATHNPTDSLTVRLVLKGETNVVHRAVVELRLEEEEGRMFVPFDTLTWQGYAAQTFTIRVSQAKLQDDNVLRIRINVIDDPINTTPNFVLLDWIEVRYQRMLAAIDGRLKTTADPGTYRFDLSGFSGPSVWIYDPAGAQVFTETATGGAVSFADAPAITKSYWAVQAGSYRTPVTVRTAPTTDLANTANGADYVILTTPMLRPSAENLADYRASQEGGGYTVRIVELHHVFNQFDYGRQTPLAIRRFVRATQRWATPPRFLMMWGDALYPNRQRPRALWEVPSYGNASSDGWFAMQNGGLKDWSESLAIGRVTMRDNDRGNTFVEKIQQYESRPFEAWQKRAAFLVGGTSVSEKNVLQNLTLNWSRQAAVASSGLDTLHFFKNSSAPLDPTFKDSLSTAFREGISWLNYFGHSASQTWEIVTDLPQNFDNALRLPVALSFGCFTGNFATGNGDDGDTYSFGEQLVAASVNGSIAHFGSTDKGTIGASSDMGNDIHGRIFGDTLRVLGLAMQMAKADYSTRRSDTQGIKHLLQYGLLGDPATRISLPTRPDFLVTNTEISVAPIAPIAADSNMVVTVRPRNFGLIPADSVDLMLTHHLPEGPAVTYTRRLPPFALTEAASFVLPINEAAIGENRFTVTIDPLGVYDEENEFNNTAERSQVVFSTGLALNTPYQFGLVDTPTPVLRVSLAAPTATALDVVFQLDTASSFDSPNRVEARVPQTEFVTSWQPPEALTNGTTYHWRARLDDPSQPENWRQGAFTVRTDLGRQGWLQQGELFEVNEQSSFLERVDGAWNFKTYSQEIQVSSVRFGGQVLGSISINGQQFLANTLGFGVLVLDGANNTHVKAAGAMATYPNDFTDYQADYDSLLSVVAKAEAGDYVFVRTRHFATKGATEIPDSVKAVFRGLGSVAIDTLTYKDMWVLMAHVGHPEDLQEWTTPPASGVEGNELVRKLELPLRFAEGTTTSPLIGPARSWTSLGWQETLTNDASEISVEVLAPDGTTLLRGPLDEPGFINLSMLEADTYPFLRLRATLVDSSLASTPQLDAWYISFDPVAELALDPFALTVSADTLQEGQPMEISLRVRNLNERDVDVTVIDYLVTNAANETSLVHADTLLDTNRDINSSFTLPTYGLGGNNQLVLSVRQPGIPERQTFDNVLIKPFVVRRDATPPEFEVLIDGEAFPSDPNPVVNLQDPALPFVSFSPTVEISIRDENEFLAIRDDSMVVTVTLDGKEIPFEALAAGKRRDNTLFLVFEPDLSGPDTTHTLNVSVQDITGNEAANSPYQIHFRTQSELEIESIYPYPNPMSTATVFAFRLRGRDALMMEDFRLRLYTVTGRLIREFDLIEDPSALEAGALRIGWNKLRWDGRDEDGDLVATGVYLYRAFARAEGQDVALGSTSRIEKIVVIR